jgi:Domain of unknown function (DUF4192)
MSSSRSPRKRRPRRSSSTVAGDEAQVVRASSPRDIVAAVPFLCGFHPAESIVVISLRGPRKRFGMVSRLDLPPAEGGPDAVARWDEEQIAADVAGFVARDGGNGAVVAVYDHLEWTAGQRPHEAFVAALVRSLEARGLPVVDALYVSPERYWSYLCTAERCCPAQGRSVADARSSPVAMAYVLAGLAPVASREALADRLTPRSPLLLAAVEDSIWRWLEAQAADLDGVVDRFAPGSAAGFALPEIRRDHLRRWTGETFALMAALVPAYRDGGGEISIEQAGQLLASLYSRDIRDAVLMGFCRYGMAPPQDRSELLAIGFDPELAVVDNLGLSGGGEPGPDGSEPADPELSHRTDDAVERLLVDLCRRVEGPFACAPLTMLAWHSWARGEGALARVSVERALTHDPTYRLATLLLSALDHAMAPEWVKEVRRSDERAS